MKQLRRLTSGILLICLCLTFVGCESTLNKIQDADEWFKENWW